MKIDYAYHITVDGEVIFLGSKLEVIEEDKAARDGTLERIGPSGIYVQYPGLKNTTLFCYLCVLERRIKLDKLIKRKGEFVYLSIAENMPKEKQEIEATKEILEALYATWLKLAEYEDVGISPKEIKEFLADFGISIAMENRELKKELQDNEEIISRMAKRLKAFEENTFNSRWIPISERLPNDEECDKYDNLHPLSRKFLCTIKIGDFNPEPRLMFFSKVFGWKYGADDYNEYVIAWQPLPEPYILGELSV